MNRLHRPRCTNNSDLPHTCGDEPFFGVNAFPRLSIYPTHVGMNRLAVGKRPPVQYLPHTCGDEPYLLLFYLILPHLPHTCGDEPITSDWGTQEQAIYPTHVGMNRINSPGFRHGWHLPHTCGDEP